MMVRIEKDPLTILKKNMEHGKTQKTWDITPLTIKISINLYLDLHFQVGPPVVAVCG
jgi:hypothetical protein